MLTRALVNILAIGGIALAGLAGVIARLTTGRRRKKVSAALAIALATLSVLFWTFTALSSYQLILPAPVANALTIYFSGQNCNGFTSLACESDRALYAVRARDGVARWRRPMSGPTYLDSPDPILRNGVLYVTTGNGQSGGIVVSAIRASDGATLWRVARPTFGIMRLSGDNLFLETSLAASSDPMREVTQVDVLRLSDGATARTVALPPGDGPLTLDGGAAYRCQSDGALVALSLRDGHPIWRTVVHAAPTKTQGAATCVSTVVSGVVYVQTGAPTYPNQLTDSSIVAVRASDGRVLWRYHTGPSAPLTMSGGAIFTVMYVATSPSQPSAGPPPPENVLIALRASDGALLWRRSLGALYGNTVAVTAGHDAVYVGLTGSLLALRVNDGALLWRYHDAPNHRLSPLAAQDGVIIVLSGFAGSGLAYENGFPQPYLLALRPADGALYWQTAFAVEGPPALGLVQ